jgi:hypothetical protein
VNGSRPSEVIGIKGQARIGPSYRRVDEPSPSQGEGARSRTLGRIARALPRPAQDRKLHGRWKTRRGKGREKIAAISESNPGNLLFPSESLASSSAERAARAYSWARSHFCLSLAVIASTAARDSTVNPNSDRELAFVHEASSSSSWRSPERRTNSLRKSIVKKFQAPPLFRRQRKSIAVRKNNLNGGVRDIHGHSRVIPGLRDG